MNNETETIRHWLFNDEILYDFVTAKADDLYDICEEDIGEVRVQLSEWLGSQFGEVVGGIPNYQEDLLQEALNNVDWHEIAFDFTELDENAEYQYHHGTGRK